EEDDYRHRMLMNGAALLVVLVLAVVGIWIANTMAEMRKNQDCVLSGRRGCTPVTVAPAPREWTRRQFFFSTATDTGASPLKPSSFAAAGVMSMMRPRTNGPRSLMRTTTVRPLRRFFTSTSVPNGSVRCAAVMRRGLAISPLAVLLPEWK